MDFFKICTKKPRGNDVEFEVYPDFIVAKYKDLMVRGQAFYAVWDEDAGLWSTDEYEVRRIVDEAVIAEAEKLRAEGVPCVAKLSGSMDSGLWVKFRKLLKNLPDNSHDLDTALTFADTNVKKSSYVSRRLPYAFAEGPHSAYDELMSTLYAPEERAKIEWAIGSLVAGDSKTIQKFIALYGPPGSGKGTILDILKKLFPGYYTTFEAKSLVGNDNFATSAFKDNPLIAIDPDAELSKIADNTKLNSITSHDELRLNEKYKPTYTNRMKAFVFIGTNSPIQITDAKSGIIRRLIDVQPTGNHVEVNRYLTLMSQVDFELGAIAHHCLGVYQSMGKNYYNAYQPLNMMLKTDEFFNFIEAHYDVFKGQPGVSLKQAFSLYKDYCEYAEHKFKHPMYKFREELKNYFLVFEERAEVEGNTVRNYYSGFSAQPFKQPLKQDAKAFSLVLDETVSLFDSEYSDLPAQYGKTNETPSKYWTDDERLVNGVMQKPRPSQVSTSFLADLDTSKLHFVRVPENHIVIDFDLKNSGGEKSLEQNLEAASLWPPTYAELSKSGGGVHLHYIYDGDTAELANEYSEGVEIKIFRGGSSLRRKLTKCNNVPVATISSGLPFKEKTTVIDQKTIQTEKGLRDLIGRNLRKEVHPGTKPSIDFIAHILQEAYDGGVVYDVTDLRSTIMVFANNSSHQAMPSLKVVQKMKFKSETPVDEQAMVQIGPKGESPIVYFDVEVFPNLFIICWNYEDSDTVVRMINPSAAEVESLLNFRLVGFNNRKYDNHILWGAFLGLNNQQLYELSKRIIAGDHTAWYAAAFNISYADIYDYSTEKMGLKKWMIKLGMHHMEMDLPWDDPVPEERWLDVADYCCNDVIGTKALAKHLEQDLICRKILASLSGMDVNTTNRRHAEKIIFGTDREPQSEFLYTDLSQEFPGYTFDPYAPSDKSLYRGKSVGEGGYVYAVPGIYHDVAVLDVASMHPTSIVELELFGRYTEKFANLLGARLFIKRQDWHGAVTLLPELAAIKEPRTKADFDSLALALKLVINSIYGYTAATFPNVFRDIRNVDNIVAKRGALMMVDLLFAVENQGFQVVHIKTDSIKIPNATPEIIQFVMDFGQKYGYEFEHEDTYSDFCLVNDSVYIALVEAKKDVPVHWNAVGAQFQHPVVFKGLFTGDHITFDDLCLTKQVDSPSSMYLDFNESKATPTNRDGGMQFVGRTGRFVPVNEWIGGAKLIRVKDGAVHAVTGTKGYLWLEADMIKTLHLAEVERMTFEELTMSDDEPGSIRWVVDMRYFENMVNNAIATIENFGDFEEFVKNGKNTCR